MSFAPRGHLYDPEQEFPLFAIGIGRNRFKRKALALRPLEWANKHPAKAQLAHGR